MHARAEISRATELARTFALVVNSIRQDAVVLKEAHDDTAVPR